MPFEVSWYMPQHIIHSKVLFYLTMEESQQIVHELGEYLENSTAGQVHILGDLSELADDDMTFRILLSVVTSLSLYRNVGWIVVIGQAEQLSQLGSAIATQFFKMRYHTCESIEEAMAFLQSQDNSLR